MGFTDVKLSQPELEAHLAKIDQDGCCDYLTRFNALNPAGIRVSGYVGSNELSGGILTGSLGATRIMFDKVK